MYPIDTVFLGVWGFARVLKKPENIALLIVFKWEWKAVNGLTKLNSLRSG